MSSTCSGENKLVGKLELSFKFGLNLTSSKFWDWLLSEGFGSYWTHRLAGKALPVDMFLPCNHLLGWSCPLKKKACTCFVLQYFLKIFALMSDWLAGGYVCGNTSCLDADYQGSDRKEITERFPSKQKSPWSDKTQTICAIPRSVFSFLYPIPLFPSRTAPCTAKKTINVRGRMRHSKVTHSPPRLRKIETGLETRIYPMCKSFAYVI